MQLQKENICAYLNILEVEQDFLCLTPKPKPFKENVDIFDYIIYLNFPIYNSSNMVHTKNCFCTGYQKNSE